MYTLYYAPVTAAFAPHAVLEELGLDYALAPVDISRDKPRDPAYLALNPNGWVPTLVDENGPMHEAAAIVIYLADKHGATELAPSATDPDRGSFLKWLIYMADTLQVAYQMHFYPERHSTDPAAIPAIQAKAAERLETVWGRLEAALDPGPYLLGSRYSACDIYLYMLATWHPEGEAFLARVPRIAACVDLVTRRPAIRRVMTAHGLE